MGSKASHNLRGAQLHPVRKAPPAPGPSQSHDVPVPESMKPFVNHAILEAANRQGMGGFLLEGGSHNPFPAQPKPKKRR